MNLLKETINDIERAKLKIEDITFIGSKDGKYRCTWNEFESLANIEYYDGFGGQEIANDLTIVFRNGVICNRHEYDGSECWVFHVLPPILDNPNKIKKLHGGMWESIAEIEQNIINDESN